MFTFKPKAEIDKEKLQAEKQAKIQAIKEEKRIELDRGYEFAPGYFMNHSTQTTSRWNYTITMINKLEFPFKWFCDNKDNSGQNKEYFIESKEEMESIAIGYGFHLAKTLNDENDKIKMLS